MKKYKGIIFDLMMETLLDTIEDLTDSVNDVMFTAISFSTT